MRCLPDCLVDGATPAAAARDCGSVVTAEDHFRHGGLGTCVAEALATEGVAARLEVLAVDSYGQSGEPGELYDHYGIDAAHIAAAARELRQTG